MMDSSAKVMKRLETDNDLRALVLYLWPAEDAMKNFGRVSEKDLLDISMEWDGAVLGYFPELANDSGRMTTEEKVKWEDLLSRIRTILPVIRRLGWSVPDLTLI